MNSEPIDVGDKNQQPLRFQKARQCGAAPGAGSPAGRQRRKRDAVGCTVVHAVAAAPLVSGMGNTVMASGPRLRLRSGRNSALC
jgi:hypothetical protein